MGPVISRHVTFEQESKKIGSEKAAVCRDFQKSFSAEGCQKQTCLGDICRQEVRRDERCRVPKVQDAVHCMLIGPCHLIVCVLSCAATYQAPHHPMAQPTSHVEMELLLHLHPFSCAPHKPLIVMHEPSLSDCESPSNY